MGCRPRSESPERDLGTPFRQPDTSANRHLAWNTLLGGCYALGYQPSCLRFALHACEILGRDKRERDRPDVKSAHRCGGSVGLDHQCVTWRSLGDARDMLNDMQSPSTWLALVACTLTI